MKDPMEWLKNEFENKEKELLEQLKNAEAKGWDNDRAGTLFKLAEFYAHNKDWDRAFDRAKQGFELTKGLVVYNNYLNLLTRSNQLDDAIKFVEHVQSICETSSIPLPEDHFRRALPIYRLTKRVDEKLVSALRGYIEESKNDPLYEYSWNEHSNLANILQFELNQIDESIIEREKIWKYFDTQRQKAPLPILSLEAHIANGIHLEQIYVERGLGEKSISILLKLLEDVREPVKFDPSPTVVADLLTDLALAYKSIGDLAQENITRDEAQKYCDENQCEDEELLKRFKLLSS
jgi:tetratricopeptide (TPR) repeat protein